MVENKIVTKPKVIFSHIANGNFMQNGNFTPTTQVNITNNEYKQRIIRWILWEYNTSQAMVLPKRQPECNNEQQAAPAYKRTSVFLQKQECHGRQRPFSD